MADGDLEFGQVHYVYPTGPHTTTIVWLHDIGHLGTTALQNLQNLRHRNVKWICPTAPIRRVSSLDGQEATAWCDLTEVSEHMQDDFGNLNSVDEFITTLLSAERENIVKGVAGIGLGAAQALYYTSCYAFEWVPICPQIVIGINGWLPGWKFLEDTMNHTNSGTTNRARSTRILVIRVNSEDLLDVVPAVIARASVVSLQNAEFPTLFKISEGNDVMNEILDWMKNLGI